MGSNPTPSAREPARFIDYNQNAKDRTVASAWSVRPTPDARVSMPLDWNEVSDCDPAAFTLVTAPARFVERGDAAAGLEAAAFLKVDDILVDSMRGRSSTWTRIRINLRHVPEDKRPAEGTPDPDYDPWREWHRGPRMPRRTNSRSRAEAKVAVVRS